MLFNKNTYDIVYSLGSTCTASGFLNKHHLRVTSGPFDWWGLKDPHKENFAWHAQLICNHFENFLRKEDLVYAQLTESDPRDPYFHPYILRDSPNFYFPHEFPVDEPMEKNYDRIKAKYDRRIARFYEKIQAASRVLLVWICPDEIGCDPDDIVRYCDDICRALGKTVDFLLIWQDDSMGLEQPAIKHVLRPNITLWRANIRRRSADNVPEYLGAAELVSPILEPYALKGTRLLMIKARARVLFGRFICLFIPVRSWRKKLRAYFGKNDFNKDFSRDIKNL